MKNGTQEFTKDIEFDIASDIYDLTLTQTTPRNAEEATKLASSLPKLLQSTNDGKGVPVEYVLLSYDTIQKLTEAVITDGTNVVYPIGEAITEQCIEKVDHAKSLCQRLSDLHKDLMANQILFKKGKDSTTEKVFGVVQQFQEILRQIKLDFAEKLIEVRKGIKKPEDLIDFLTKRLDEDSEIKCDIETINFFLVTKTMSFTEGAYYYLGLWRVQITQKIKFMSTFFSDELKKPNPLVTSYPIKISKQQGRGSIAVFYFRSYEKFLASGEFRGLRDFQDACRLVDEANGVDVNEKPLGDYLVIDGELQEKAVETFAACKPVDELYPDYTAYDIIDEEQEDTESLKIFNYGFFYYKGQGTM